MKTRKSFFTYAGAIISILTVLMILIGYVWTPYDPEAMSAVDKLKAPSFAHIMGTDNFGRDIFSRVLDGAGTSLLIALCVVVIGCIFGIVIGALCGYYGGVADAVLTRVCDSITAFPSFLLALVIVSVIGEGTYNIIIALGILFIPSFARVVRAEFAKQRERKYVANARLMGVKDIRIIVCHILPNLKSVLIPTVIIGFNNAILSESSMSFLGIGIQPPQASLGSMLSDSQTYLSSAPWYALGVGGVIALLILGFSLLSEGLSRDRVI